MTRDELAKEGYDLYEHLQVLEADRQVTVWRLAEVRKSIQQIDNTPESPAEELS